MLSFIQNDFFLLNIFADKETIYIFTLIEENKQTLFNILKPNHMKIQHIISTVLLCCFTIAGFAQTKHKSSLPFRFATKAEAQMLVTDIDNFSNGLNQFDIDLRLQKVDGRKSEWLRLAMSEAMNWSDAEKDKVTKAFKTIKANIKKLKLNLPYPDEIVLLKTSMKEELNMGAYTRKHWIAIGQDFVTKADHELLCYLIGHELFHVLSRKNVDFKRAVYATIGFNVVDHEILLPTDILAKRISNPDIERRDSYTTLNINGTDTKCVQIMYTNKEFTTGGVMDYLNVGFIPLNEDFIPVIKDGQTVIHPMSEVADQIKQKVGENTGYTIDPEEVSADHFSFLLMGKKDLKNPEIINAIKVALTQK